MADTSILAIFAVVVLCCYFQYRGFRRYLTEAKQSGLKYVLTPFYFQSIPWIVLQEALLPLLKKLPRSRIESWLPPSLFYRVWHFGYEPFSQIGHDTFLTTSPSGNVLWTCEPKVVDQILNRRHDFSKPYGLERLLNIYGPTITSTEGEEHMIYRRIAASSINETTHRKVWNESIEQAEIMTNVWDDRRGEVPDVHVDTLKQALRVLSKVFFDRPMPWNDDADPPPGHLLNYNKAASDLFKYTNTLFLTSQAVLSISPFEVHKKAKLAYDEMKMYMEEMREETEQSLRNSCSSSPPQSTKLNNNESSLRENFVKAGMPEFNATPNTLVSKDAIFGNFFIFIFASLETSANTLADAFVLLACRPEFQKAMQADIDSIFPSDNNSDQSYSSATARMEGKYMSSFTRLWNGHVGSLMQEILRLWNVVMFIPKVNPQTTTIIRDNGQQCTIPANTLTMINVAATHRNPKYWPTSPSRKYEAPKDHDDFLWTKNSLSEFQPERWLADPSLAETKEAKHDPPKGAYIPFSDGFRSCKGSRLARVEFCATIARVFAEWSVELADNSPAGLQHAERCLTQEMRYEMTLFMKKPVGLRFVRRSVKSS